MRAHPPSRLRCWGVILPLLGSACSLASVPSGIKCNSNGSCLDDWEVPRRCVLSAGRGTDVQRGELVRRGIDRNDGGRDVHVFQCFVYGRDRDSLRCQLWFEHEWDRDHDHGYDHDHDLDHRDGDHHQR